MGQKSDYVPPGLNSTKRYNDMDAKGKALSNPPAAPPAKDDSAERIKKSAKSMDDLSMEALMRRARAAEGK